MMVCGTYVKSFNEASHALPDGMHMNADYPFMLPRIVKVENGIVTIEGQLGQIGTFKIIKRDGREYGYIEQSSSFEKMCNRKPHRFRMLPFRDDRTDAIGTTNDPQSH